MVTIRVAVNRSFPLKVVPAEQAEGCAVRKGGDALSGYLELAESCLVGYEFVIKLEGWCQLTSK